MRKLFLLSFFVLLSGCSVATIGSGAKDVATVVGSSFQTMVNNEANVEVSVTPVDLGSDKEFWTFDVGLSTHSVELGEDLMEVSVLRMSDGMELRPTAWNGSPPGGHHREGVLTFKNPGVGLDRIDLEIRDIGGVAVRRFEWEL